MVIGQPLPPAPPPARWTQVDVSALRVERVRDFGEVFLALALWRLQANALRRLLALPVLAEPCPGPRGVRNNSAKKQQFELI